MERSGASSPLVTWIADTRRDLGDDLRQQLDRELRQAFVDHRPTQIIVKQRFRGFTDLPVRKLTIAVEVQGERGSHASVVKIGEASEVRVDHDGWQSCAGQRGVSSRMFIAPQLREFVDGCVGDANPFLNLLASELFEQAPDPCLIHAELLERLETALEAGLRWHRSMGRGVVA